MLKSPPKRWLVLALLTVLVLPPLVFSAWAWVTLTYVYARGERVGYVQKISKKGWVVKTWEGELAMVNLPGAMPEIFPFTVRDEAVVQDIQRAAGQRVALSYEQHKGIPSTCFGETEYFVTHVQPIIDAAPGSTPPAKPAPGVPST